MKTLKLTFDFSDNPQIVELLRVEAAQGNSSQKNIVLKALTAYFATKSDTQSLYKLANKAFADWDNPEDSIYDDL